MKKINRYSFFVLFILMFFSITNVVYAEDIYAFKFSGKAICYNLANGEYGTYVNNNGGDGCPAGYATSDAVKLINGEYVYCVERSLPIESHYYVIDSSWNEYERKAIIAGMLIDKVAQNYSNEYERYAMTGAILNTYFHREQGFSASYDFYSNKNIKSIYDSVLDEGNQLKLTGTIPSPSFKRYGSSTMNTLNDFYISNKIELSGLYSKFGGSTNFGNSQVNYELKATVQGAKAEICENALGTKCHESVTISPKSNSEKYTFYVKVSSIDGSDVIAGSRVSVSVTATNASVYPTIIKFVNRDYDNNQDLVQRTTVAYNRTGGQTVSLYVPNNVNHSIVVEKVDEHGKLLSGASLEIYKDDYKLDNNLLKTNSSGAASFEYISESVAENDDDFFEHDYYLIEKSAPDGYVLQSQVNHFHIKGTSSKNTSVCYYNGGADSDESRVENDSERCNFENYDYMCKASDGSGFKELNEDGTCNYDVIIPEEEENGGDQNIDSTPDSGENENINDDTINNDDATLGGNEEDNNNDDVTGDDNNPDDKDEEVPIVTYSSVCYKKSTNEEVDSTYCTNKANYTKVILSNGNLIVTQINPKNLIRISKQSLDKGAELTGAVLKICTSADYKENKEKCSPAKTIDDVEMSWISGVQSYEIVGIKKGDYYIVETASPKGYITLDKVLAFSIDETGTVKYGDKIITNDDFTKKDAKIVVTNKINSILVSKQDFDTSEELAGATLSICRTYVDSNGDYKLLTDQYNNECIVAILANGKEATWESLDKAKEINGLGVGTYYLVEKNAPKGYSTSDSIRFTINSDGTLLDKDGKVIDANKIVMKDKRIENVQTGEASKWIVVSVLILVIGLGTSSYYFMMMKRNVVFVKDNKDSKVVKIRKRRIYK